MKQFKAIIVDPIGLHTKPASILSAEASKYKSDIRLLANGKEANLKSVMNIMSLGIKKNCEITIKVMGPDEEEAIGKLKVILKENSLI